MLDDTEIPESPKEGIVENCDRQEQGGSRRPSSLNSRFVVAFTKVEYKDLVHSLATITE